MILRMTTYAHRGRFITWTSENVCWTWSFTTERVHLDTEKSTPTIDATQVAGSVTHLALAQATVTEVIAALFGVQTYHAKEVGTI